MKKFVTILPMICVGHFMLAQIGVSGGYAVFNGKEWYRTISNGTGENIGNSTGYSAGLDYWFRLKEKRIEFTPELSYGSVSRSSSTLTVSHRIFGLYLNTNLYLLDFNSDCDCPVWSKSGNFFTKGFFVQISPNVFNIRHKLQIETPVKDSDWALGIGVGAGIDFGVSDLITLTPMLKFNYSPSVSWENLPAESNSTVDTKSKVNLMTLGLRIGWRFDEAKKNF